MKVAVNANKTHTQTLYACNSKSEHSVETKPPTAVALARAPTHAKSRVTWKGAATGRLLWATRRTSISEKKLLFAS